MSPPDSATPIPQTHSIEDEIGASSLEAIEALLRSVATNNTDPVHSSRFSLSQSSSTNSHSGEQNFVPIEPDLYKFLVNGMKDEILGLSTNLEDFKSWAERNSVLHIAASAGQSDLISDILPQCKELIEWKNIKGDLPLHSAAKSGQFNALKALITWDGFSKEILGWVNKEGDTVLHIALQNNQKEMGEFLVGEKCIGKACYMMNNEEVCPLYLGIKLGYWDLVRNIISYTSQNKEDSEKALLQGMSVVHAAIEVNNIEILKELLSNHRNLIESWDEEGRSPLSYAAFKGYLEVVQYLLKEFPECAFKCDKDEKGSFPIHKAASGGNIKVIKELHHTKSLLNRTEQNILHVAAASGKSKLVSYLLKVQELHGLINRKDEDGNTPLHLATKGFHPRVVYILTREKRCKCELQNKNGLTALDIAEIHSGPFPTFEARLTWMALRYVDAPRSSQSTRKTYAQNNGIQKQYNKVNDTKELEGYKDRVDTHLLVATLVATVTFAAGFTLPGGYDQSNPDIGMAVLAHFWAFKVFVLCNTAALYSAILSVVTLIWAHMRDLKLILVSLKFAMVLLGFALAMMSLAFMMGIFVVLKTVPWLSYVVLGMGSVFLLTVLVIFIPLYNPSYIRNSLVRFFFSGTLLLLLIVYENSITEYD